MSSDISPAQPIRAPIKRRFATIRTIFAMMLREMNTTYGKSPLGYLWAILEPVAGIVLLSSIFSIAFDAPPLGRNFPIFYASGMVPFTMYHSVSGKVATAIMFSKPLLAYPSVTLMDAVLARFILNFLTDLMVAYIVFLSLLALFDTMVVVDLGILIQAMLMLAALAFGIGVLNAFLFSMFLSWQRTWSILMKPMFIISGIFFLFETIPQPYRDYLWYNPLIHIIGKMREGFYPTYDASYVSPVYVYGLSGICALVGIIFLKRHYKYLISY